MNWDAIGALGELAGATAVVLSLVYVAVQIRDNTRSQQAATYHAMISAKKPGQSSNLDERLCAAHFAQRIARLSRP